VKLLKTVVSLAMLIMRLVNLVKTDMLIMPRHLPVHLIQDLLVLHQTCTQHTSLVLPMTLAWSVTRESTVLSVKDLAACAQNVTRTSLSILPVECVCHK